MMRKKRRRTLAHDDQASLFSHGLRNELASSEHLSQNGLFEGKEPPFFQQGDRHGSLGPWEIFTTLDSGKLLPGE